MAKKYMNIENIEILNNFNIAGVNIIYSNNAKRFFCGACRHSDVKSYTTCKCGETRIIDVDLRYGDGKIYKCREINKIETDTEFSATLSELQIIKEEDSFEVNMTKPETIYHLTEEKGLFTKHSNDYSIREELNQDAEYFIESLFFVKNNDFMHDVVNSIEENQLRLHYVWNIYNIAKRIKDENDRKLFITHFKFFEWFIKEASFDESDYEYTDEEKRIARNNRNYLPKLEDRVDIIINKYGFKETVTTKMGLHKDMYSALHNLTYSDLRDRNSSRSLSDMENYDSYFNKKFDKLRDISKELYDAIIYCLEQGILRIYDVEKLIDTIKTHFFEPYSEKRKRMKELRESDSSYKDEYNNKIEVNISLSKVFVPFVLENIFQAGGSVFSLFKRRVFLLHEYDKDITLENLIGKDIKRLENERYMTKKCRINQLRVDAFKEIFDENPLKAIEILSERKKPTKKELEQFREA